MVKNKEQTISIDLVEIIDRELFIKEPIDKIKNNFNKESLKLGLSVNFSQSDKKNVLSLNISVKYEYPYDNKPFELLRSSFTFQFRISNMSKVIISDNGNIDMPHHLATNLISISLSTIRGLIAAKTRGYFINNYYLPIINQTKLSDMIQHEQ